MEGYWKGTALVMLTVILGVAVGKQEKDMALVLTLAACAMVLGIALTYLGEVLDFFRTLGKSDSMGILIRIAGVALMTEITGAISADGGSSALSKAVQLLGSAGILFLSLPLFEAFFAILQEILGVL